MEAKQVKDLMEAYASVYSPQPEQEVISEGDLGDRARRVVGDQRQGVHGDADAMKQDMDAINLNLLRLRPYGVKGFPSVKKDTKKTTQVAHFEPEGELVDEGLGAKAAELVDRGTKAIQSGLEKAGVPINRQKRGTVTKAEWEGKIKGNVKDDVDLFDIIKGHLMSEGYADTEEAALAIMANMSEEWRQSIIEEVDAQGNRSHDLFTGKPNPNYKPGNNTKPKPQVKKEPPMRDEPLW